VIAPALPFALVDRILACEPGRSIRAGYRMSGPRTPESDPYRVMESLAQAAGWLIASSTGFARRGVPVSIASIRLAGPVPAEGAVILEAEIAAWRGESAVIEGRATADGRVIGRMERGLCALIPAEHLEEPAQTAATFSRLASTGPREDAPRATIGGDAWPAAAALERCPGPGAGRARATWLVPPDEGYFPGHFPRLPIVPGAVQVQTLVELARSLVQEDGAAAVLRGIREAKFRGFVRPGDQLVLEAGAVTAAGERRVARAEGFVGGRRVVALGEIQFGV
jgi:3-hydroxyacyl-[acyl-carrier-protein] dehydratase